MVAMAFKEINDLLSKITDASLKKRGFPNASIILAWPNIIGAELAKVTSPHSIKFPLNSRRDGTLIISTSGAFSMNVEMAKVTIIDRVNLYFGYTAINNIRVLQG